MGIIASEKTPELLAATKELAEFLREDPVATAINVGNSFFLCAEKWKQTQPKTEAEIAEYYRSGRDYLWNLVMSNYGIPNQVRMRAEAQGAFRDESTVLDYGAGIGSTLLALPHCDCVHADVGGSIFEYAAWRYARAGKHVEMVKLPDDGRDPLGTRKFDGIVCTEVIEHVTDPEGLVARLASHLRPGGRLLASVSFDDDDGLFPQHLHVDRGGAAAGGEKCYDNERFVAEVFPRNGLRHVSGRVFEKVG